MPSTVPLPLDGKKPIISYKVVFFMNPPPPEFAGKIDLPPTHMFDQSLEAMGFEKKYGTSRIAYVGKNLTLKRPISDPKKAWKVYKSRRELDQKMGTHYASAFLSNTEDETDSLRYMIQRGYLQNLREARLSPLLGDLVVPTRLTVAGFVNVQETAQPLNHVRDEDIRQILSKRIGNASKVDPHSFHEHRNYGWHEGKVKLLDYGGQKIVQIIKTHRAGIEKALHDMMEMDLKRSV